LSFFFLTGFVPIFSIIGPGVTVLTTGNLYKAAAQLMIDHSIKKKTGKNSLTLIKEEINKNNKEYKKNKFNEDLKQLVEKRISITRQKLDNQNLQKLVKKQINVTRSKLNLNKTIQ
jgi:DNA-nicking Smr family endonuclease